VKNLTFNGRATNAAGIEGQSNDVTVTVKSDSFTTVTGRVVNSEGMPVASAKIQLILNGLEAEFFDFQQPLTTIPELEVRPANLNGLISALNVRNPADIFGHDPFGVSMAPDYAARFTGWLRVAKAGRYQFFLGADEGARAIVDGKIVVDIPTGRGEFQEGTGS